jgi:class 3 adenylate cyclase
MPEPRIQYAKTSDGVSIAYAVVGEGPPLIAVRTWAASHVQLDWEQGAPGEIYPELAKTRTIVLFDRRGTGLSDRDVTDLSLEKLLLDLDAVVEQLGLRRFALLGTGFGTVLCALYAVRHPERVSAIISLAGVISGKAFWNSPRNRALRAMREADFDTYVDMIRVLSGNPRMSDNWRESITAEGQKLFVDTSESFDATEFLPQLNLPVLVLFRTNFANAPDEGAFSRELAKRISGARLAGVPYEPRKAYIEGVASAVNDFLGDALQAVPKSSGTFGLQTILFTDLVSSTALTQRLGDAKAQELVRAHNTIVREALAAHGGTEIKHTGDGIMASFGTASGALECAIAIQRAVAEEGARHASPLRVHIGVNAGEPMVEESDLFGTSVQLARRICDHASSGQILVSNVVRELSAGKGFLFADIGEVVPKGFEEPVRLYEVRWRDA